MKRQIARFAPWIALMFVGVISTPRMANTTPPPQERHPHIRAAIQELRATREELTTAADDFCGHRAEAVRMTDAAIRQLQLAVECDRK
jgi:type II secretory pathway component PulM